MNPKCSHTQPSLYTNTISNTEKLEHFINSYIFTLTTALNLKSKLDHAKLIQSKLTVKIEII